MINEEKTTPETYLLQCAKCSINSKNKKKFIVHGISRRKGILLKCMDCGHFVTRKLNKLGNLKTQKNYTEEQINFLRHNYEFTNTTREELLKKFNEKFNENTCKSTLGFVLSKHKILKDRKYHKRCTTLYDEEKVNFLRQHYECTDTTKKELTQLFNENFKLNKSIFLGIILNSLLKTIS